jgi:hypothetical protein
MIDGRTGPATRRAGPRASGSGTLSRDLVRRRDRRKARASGWRRPGKQIGGPVGHGSGGSLGHLGTRQPPADRAITPTTPVQAMRVPLAALVGSRGEPAARVEVPRRPLQYFELRAFKRRGQRMFFVVLTSPSGEVSSRFPPRSSQESAIVEAQGYAAGRGLELRRRL